MRDAVASREFAVERIYWASKGMKILIIAQYWGIGPFEKRRFAIGRRHVVTHIVGISQSVRP